MKEQPSAVQYVPVDFRRLVDYAHHLVGRNTDRTLALLLALGSFALYTVTAVPGVLDGDHGQFQTMPHVLGVPHPTGYPIYMLLGWLWSWVPVGSLAFRMNLFSALWAAPTLGLAFALARQQRLKHVATWSGALALALAPAFWRYAASAEVYTLQTTLVALALVCWFRWSEVPAGSPTRRLWAAMFVTGLALTNHPTAAFLLPAAALYFVLHWVARASPLIKSLRKVTQWHGERGSERPRWRELLVGAGLFALPGLLYLYIPLRVWSIGPGIQRFGLQESIAKGRITPYIDPTLPSILRYITGYSFLGTYNAHWSLLWEALPGFLVEQFGLPLTILGIGGSLVWLVRRPRSWALLATLFLPTAAYALGFSVEFAARNQIAHLEGHLLPALLVFALWIAEGLDATMAAALRLLHRPRLVNGTAALLLVCTLGTSRWKTKVPTAADRVQSMSISRYWSEVLHYPLEAEAALVGHWGDLTPLWYFQLGEGVRPDLWALHPPAVSEMDMWLAHTGHALYLAGPLLDWSPDLSTRYHLIPWGILVRIAPRDEPVRLPPMQPKQALFGNRLQLNGYQVLSPTAERRQLWLAWRTIAPTPRDLSVSMRLHAPDGTLLLQRDGRLASLWFPEGTLPSDQSLLTVFDLHKMDDPSSVSTVRIVVYDSQTMQALLTPQGQEVFELGPWMPQAVMSTFPALRDEPGQ